MQMFQLNNYAGLSPKQPEHRFSGQIPFTSYSRGMGAMGLPGDLSSESRFAQRGVCEMQFRFRDSEKKRQPVFHILGSVDQQRGCCEVAEESMRSRFTRPAATLPKGFTIIQPMTTTRSAQ